MSWLPVLWFTFEQALLSAVGACTLGISGAVGLLAMRDGWLKKTTELILVLPSALPPLLVVLVVFQWGSWFDFSVLGRPGILLSHTLLNMGLVAFVLAHRLKARFLGWSQLAMVEGARPWLFWRYLILSVWRTDLGWVFFFVFSVCFVSFAVPLIFAANQGVTLEVLIYNRVFLHGDYKAAIGLALLQLFFVLSLSFLFSLRTKADKVVRQYLKSPFGSPVLVLGPLVLAFGALLTVGGSGWKGFFELWSHQELWRPLTRAFMVTTLVAIGVGVLLTLIYSAFALWGLPAWVQRFLLGLVAPSTVIVGLLLLIVFGYGPVSSVFAMIVGLTLLLLPILYRFVVQQKISDLQKQVEVARLLGASRGTIFKTITWPQLSPVMGFVAGLGALWACGDYALSTVVSGQDLTLGLMAQTLLASYRIDMAMGVFLLILFLGSLLLAIFGGLGRVFGQKSL